MTIKVLISVAIIIAVVYILYLNGFASLGNKKSIMFLGRYNSSKNEYSASFKSCTGQVKRVIRFKEAQNVTFTLDTVLEKGTVKANINNSKGQNILILNNENPHITVDVTAGKYFITLEFYKAYGKCTLSYK